MGAIAAYLKAARELTKMRGKKFSVSRTRGPQGERIVNIQGVSKTGPQMFAGKPKAVLMPTHTLRRPTTAELSIAPKETLLRTLPLRKIPSKVLQHELNHYNDRTHVPRAARIVNAGNSRVAELQRTTRGPEFVRGVSKLTARVGALSKRNIMRGEAKANYGLVKERTKRKKKFSPVEKQMRNAMATYVRKGRREIPNFRQRYKNFKAAGGYDSPTAHLKLSTGTCWNNLMEATLEDMLARAQGTSTYKPVGRFAQALWKLRNNIRDNPYIQRALKRPYKPVKGN